MWKMKDGVLDLVTPSAVRLIIFLFLFLLPLARSRCAFPAIFNFGDSTSDTGGIHVAFPFMTLAESSPYGETYFKRPVNRYSDGRLLIDFLAQSLGMNFLSPYLQSVDSNFSQGANFASAGATAREVTFISPFSLNIQVNQFKVFKQQVLNTIERKGQQNYLPEANAFSQGLYIIEIGGNDFSYAYMNLKITADQLRSYLPSVVRSISAAVRGLYNEGARTFWVLDVGPQGCLPFVLTKYPHTAADLDESGCAKPYNDAVISYNYLLRAEVNLLQKQLPGSSVIFVDTYDIEYSMIKDPQRFGFQFTTRACCGVGGRYNYDYGVQCGSSHAVHRQYLTALPCVNPGSYLNWDGVHFTDQANRLIARQILSGAYFEPYFPLSRFCDLNLNGI